MAFVELAARSSFSFLRGASHAEEMVDQASALKLTGITICDRDGLYGAARAYCRAREISQPLHLGAELPLAFCLSELRDMAEIDEGPGERAQRLSYSRLLESRCKQLLPGTKPNALRKRMLAEDVYPSLILLIKDHRGYQNLCWILTQAHASMPKGECLLEIDELEGHTAGLIALVPTITNPRWAARGGSAHPLDAAIDAFTDRMLIRLCDLFSANGAIYSLIYRRLNRDDAVRAQLAERRLRRFGIPVLASAWPAYHDKSRKRLADVVQCIRLGTTLRDAKTRLASNGQAYLRSERQMLRLFRDQPSWVEQTARVAEELSFDLGQLVYHFPCQPPPGETPDDALTRLSWEGAHRRYPAGVPEKVKDQIERELALIRRMEVAPYFLSTWEVVEIARERGILCQGRGSAANSAVCYALGITAVNPEHSNLLFERFMSDERREPPDIDVDFEHERREEVIQEIYARYGRDRAAMVSEVICYRQKSALREVSKVFGLSLEQCDRMVGAFAHWDPIDQVRVDPAQTDHAKTAHAKAERARADRGHTDRGHADRQRVARKYDDRVRMDRGDHLSPTMSENIMVSDRLEPGHAASRRAGRPVKTLREAAPNGQRSRLRGTARGRLQASGLDAEAPLVQGVLEMAHQLMGFPRHLSIHVGGFVLSSRPLFEVAPVEPARMADRSVVPWDKDDLDALGFFKIDVLALGMLTAIRKASRLAWEGGAFSSKETGAETAEARSFDPLEIITRIPDDDPAVYALTSRADTVGVFQIESRAQMAMLPRLRPRCFYDLVIEVAIVRPGPIQGGMVHPYLRRRNGEEEPSCHPLLERILERTLGVPLFQEQVMQIAIVGAGYSGGEADQLRRDMAAWKKTGRLMRHRERLLAGFDRNGVDRAFGEALFEQIKGFGEYGFPESHAASFALLVYKSAWLKAHYPAHFLCALLNSQPMGFYSPSSLVRDAQKHGVEVRPVCVASSEWDNTLEAPSEKSGLESSRVEREGPNPHLSDPGSNRAVRLGLRMVKGLTRASADRITSCRHAFSALGRAFRDFEDFDEHVTLPRRDLEALAEAGAFEKLEPERRQVLWAVRRPRQSGLFGERRLPEPSVRLPALAAVEVLALDYERVRLSIVDHPLCHLREQLDQTSVLTTAALGRCSAGERVSVAGLVTARQRPGTASGVVFVTLEDETGVANLIFYRGVFDAHRFVAQHSPLLLARGKIERQDPNPESLDPSDPCQKNGVASIVHLIVESVERLTLPGPRLNRLSRDFH